MTVYYHFVSTLRQGLAGQIERSPEGKRAVIDLSLQVARRKVGSEEWDANASPVARSVYLYGPGDVTGFDRRIVSRTDPAPRSGNFEPNYFPAIEFSDPDFVWRFSPEPPDGRGQTMPWIALIVLHSEEFEIPKRGTNQRPAIRIHSQESLPDPSTLRRWCHVQGTSGDESLGADEEARGEELERLAGEGPEVLVSRLICPRRLAPKTRYRAFVVPTYALGRAAGLDTAEAWSEVAERGAIDPAWDHQTPDEIVLPYFYDWEFQTSQRGDFEFLVRMLEGRTLENLGLRDLDCTSPGFGLTVEEPLRWEGALKSLDTTYTSWGRDRPGTSQPEPFRVQLAAHVLNRSTPTVQVERAPNFDPNGVLEEFTPSLLSDGRSVRFYWKTAGPTEGVLEIGPENRDGTYLYSSSHASGGLDNEHEVVLPLVPERSYHVAIVTTASGNTTRTGDAGVRVPLPVLTPPIYGRWHAARSRVSAAADEGGWLHELNLDPRHRAAAGLGSEVVRKQQEGLMASAWDQIGAVEAANDLLRRAQLGREGSLRLHQRLARLPLEDFLRVTAPAQKRVVRTGEDQERRTVATEIPARSQIPAAAVAPAFRRIARARGPLRKIQGTRRGDMLARMAAGELSPAGPPPELPGIVGLCDVSRSLAAAHAATLVPHVTLTATAAPTNDGERYDVTVSWVTERASRREASGDLGFAGTKPATGHESFGPFAFPPGASTGTGSPSGGVVSGGSLGGPGVVLPMAAQHHFRLECEGPFGTTVASTSVTVSSTGMVTQGPPALESSEEPRDSAVRLCERKMRCADVKSAVASAFESIGIDGQVDVANAACFAFDELRPPPPTPAPPVRGIAWLEKLRSDVLSALDPNETVRTRAERRVPVIAKRVADGWNGDPLDEIIAHPVFPQPMYEPLRDLSKSHVLPGVETVPQNTVGLLKTNGRFLESYMVGINHELSRELLWRGYPTDQRGTYCSQFWRVDEFVPDDEQVDEDGTLKSELENQLKDIRPIHEWDDSPLGANDPRPLHQWGANGTAATEEEQLVLVVRGDLLKRYPNAVIYAVGARNEGTEESPSLKPELPEFGGTSDRPIFPVFKGALGADLVFFGFPFGERAARSAMVDKRLVSEGMFFVIEERMGEARFGLDSATSNSPGPVELNAWSDLNWGHFGQADGGEHSYIGDAAISVQGDSWNDLTSAELASATLQQPARLVIHADQLIPKPAQA
ncbi:MAG: hypothetical protein JJ863_17740 [Deltaproteobacteria bacterium]|nr:hypothetical protein [Deltaproteobacteria bacterium]